MANKKSRSIEEQIELLKQRGMIVGDEAFAARHLAHISYYRLKGYWWDMQYDKTRHLFQPIPIWKMSSHAIILIKNCALFYSMPSKQ